MKRLTFALTIVVAAVLGSAASAQELSKRDQIHVAVQEICPVSGQKLGAHGAPIKVRIGEEVVFLCCKGCLQGQVNPQHWATVHANFARAQQICPVMKHKLPQNPKWTIIQGQIVYVCCPPCIQKAAADPRGILQQIDDLYAASLRSREESR